MSVAALNPQQAGPPAVVAGPQVGRLSGTVTEATSDAPVAGVEIIVHATVIDGPRLATTDSDGHYDIGGLPFGTFTVSARFPGYVQTGFGFRHLQGTQSTIVLGEGGTAHRERVDIRLTKESSVAGRVLDDSGEPVTGATVTVLRPFLDKGHRVLKSFGTTRTDADGRYRIAGLLRGDYYVTAFEPDPTVTTAAVAVHSPTYYAGYADAAGATRVNVTMAANVTGIEFVVRRVPWSRILGEVRRAGDGGGPRCGRRGVNAVPGGHVVRYHALHVSRQQGSRCRPVAHLGPTRGWQQIWRRTEGHHWVQRPFSCQRRGCRTAIDPRRRCPSTMVT